MKRKPGAPHKGWKAAAKKTAEPTKPKTTTDSAHWSAVIEAMATKKTAPRKPRGE